MTRVEIEAIDGNEAKKVKNKLVSMGCQVESLNAEIGEGVKMIFSCKDSVIDDILDNIEEDFGTRRIKFVP